LRKQNVIKKQQLPTNKNYCRQCCQSKGINEFDLKDDGTQYKQCNSCRLKKKEHKIKQNDELANNIPKDHKLCRTCKLYKHQDKIKDNKCNDCIIIQKEKAKLRKQRYYEKNKLKLRQKHKEYYDKHREDIIESKRQCRIKS